MKVLILGNGLLGSELARQTGWDVKSRKEDGVDICNPESYDISGYDVVINCIACTDTYSKDKELHWNVNYKGVADLVDKCNEQGVKLVQISSDYVYANSEPDASEDSVPVHHESWYGYTKLLSDGHVQLKSNDYLLVRCGHKPRPFPYDKATSAVVGNFDYVDTISSMIVLLIISEESGVHNVGTEKKTMYELAKASRNVEEMKSLPVETMPRDVSMIIK
jgi:dTDP-4-dehydrorhamnose reductase